MILRKDRELEDFEMLTGVKLMPIDKPYAYHKPSEDGLAHINAIRNAYSHLERILVQHCPPSRQLSIAITNNEQAAMWAIKAIVFNDPQSQVE